MLDNYSINIKALLEMWPIHADDEHWWSFLYVTKTEPHCIVGNSLVVHFSYFPTMDALVNSALINVFEQIAYEEHSDLPREVWAKLLSD